MRKISQVIIHCAYTKPSMDIGVEEINGWHWQRGFMSPYGVSCGYHFVIRRDGTIENGRSLKEVGAHTKGANTSSIGICLSGGMGRKGGEDSNFTYQQYDSLRTLCQKLEVDFPGVTFHGHRDFSSKACPCFDVKAFLGA